MANQHLDNSAGTKKIMLSLFFDYKFNAKGIDITVLFGRIKIAHLPIERIKSVSIETSISIFKHTFLHLVDVCSLINRWTWRILVVETSSGLCRYWYLTPYNAKEAIKALSLPMENQASIVD